MQTRTDGDYAHRLDVIEAAMDALDDNTKTATVLAAYERARQDLQAKEKGAGAFRYDAGISRGSECPDNATSL